MRKLRFGVPVKHSWLVLGAVAVMAVGAAMPAVADSVTGTAAVTGGTLGQAGTTAPGFTVALDGSDQTPTANFTTNVTDPRGTGSGWHLTVSATTLTSTAPAATFADTNTFSMTSSVATCLAGSTCTPTTSATVMPVAITTAATTPPAVAFFSAAVGSGKGKFLITSALRLTVPAQTSIGNYTSTIAIAIIAGP